MRKHSLAMTAAWAKDWGIRGYEHLDPQQREQRRQSSNKKMRERDRRDNQRRYKDEQSTRR